MVLNQRWDVQVDFESGLKSVTSNLIRRFVTRKIGNIGQGLKLASMVLSHLVLNDGTFVYVDGICSLEWEHERSMRDTSRFVNYKQHSVGRRECPQVMAFRTGRVKRAQALESGRLQFKSLLCPSLATPRRPHITSQPCVLGLQNVSSQGSVYKALCTMPGT